jgi:hypothetical protein
MICDLRFAISDNRADDVRRQSRRDRGPVAQSQRGCGVSPGVSFQELHKPAAVEILFRSLTQGGFQPESLGIFGHTLVGPQSSIINRKS